MLRNKLLLAVAAIALTAGTGALAQQENRTGPAEKSAPATTNKPNGGAPQQNRSEPSNRAGQAGRSETTGQASQERSNPAGNAKDDKAAQEHKGAQNMPERTNRSERERPAAEQNQRTRREDRNPSTTGQANERRDDSNRRDDNAQINRGRENTDRERTTIDRNRTQGDGENRATTGAAPSNNVSVNLTEQQRTRIHEVIVKDRSAPRVSSVDFSLTIGTAVPRSVKLVRVPSTIVEIEPAWRGFEFFMVGDEIVIVDPRYMHIVAVIPA